MIDKNLFAWLVFGLIILTLIITDLGIFNKKDKTISFRKSIILSSFYIIIACAFGIFVFYVYGAQSSKEYFTSFLLEKAMSLDNIFVISMIFTFFKIPSNFQHKVLFWGILGVIILRAIMISVGASLITHFSWVLYIFAAILIYTGIKTLIISNNTENINVQDIFIYKFLSKHINLTSKLNSNKFFITKNNKLTATPLFAALITIETMDIVFAIDSIPAIFAITQDIYVVYTSNIFAILGLRALFFLLANIVTRFRYIKHSLALILILIGIKIFIAHYINIPAYIPLIVIITLLFGGGVLSIVIKKTI